MWLMGRPVSISPPAGQTLSLACGQIYAATPGRIPETIPSGAGKISRLHGDIRVLERV
jgi:hypothetical protein